MVTKEPEKNEQNKTKTAIFDELSRVDCSGKVEKKNGINYLSWPFAWSELKKRYPNAQYEIIKYNGLPYVYDEKTGYMVYTRVTIEDISHDMWLPVMDCNNYAMKSEPYEVVTKYKKFTVQPATMFDINKTIMRCLVKNLAMFGLGLFIYAKEDYPEDTDKDNTTAPETAKAPTEAKQTETTAPKKPNKVREDFVNFCKENDVKGEEFNTICKMFKLNNAAPDESFNQALDYTKAQVKKRIYAEALAREALGDLPEEV